MARGGFALPKIAGQAGASLLHSLGRSMSANPLRILHKAAIYLSKS
jgi:hypothetical protein